MDSSDNSIYQGIGQIKYLNESVGDELYSLSQLNNYNSFTQLLSDISNTSANSRQMEILIKLDYFRDFGQAKTLLNLFNLYNDWADKSQFHKENNKDDMLKFIKMGVSLKDIKESSDETNKLYRNIDFPRLIQIVEDNCEQFDYSIPEKIEFQDEYLGYVNIQLDGYDDSTAICLGADLKYSPKLNFMSLGNGNMFQAKIKRKKYKNNPVGKYDIVDIYDIQQKYGWTKDGDDWKRDPNRLVWWVEKYNVRSD